MKSGGVFENVPLQNGACSSTADASLRTYQAQNHPQLWEMWTVSPYTSRMRHEFRNIMSGIIDRFRFTWLQPVSPFFYTLFSCTFLVQSLASAEGSSCRCTWSSGIFARSVKMILGKSSKEVTKKRSQTKNQAWKPSQVGTSRVSKKRYDNFPKNNHLKKR